MMAEIGTRSKVAEIGTRSNFDPSAQFVDVVPRPLASTRLMVLGIIVLTIVLVIVRFVKRGVQLLQEGGHRDRSDMMGVHLRDVNRGNERQRRADDATHTAHHPPSSCAPKRPRGRTHGD